MNSLQKSLVSFLITFATTVEPDGLTFKIIFSWHNHNQLHAMQSVSQTVLKRGTFVATQPHKLWQIDKDEICGELPFSEAYGHKSLSWSDNDDDNNDSKRKLEGLM